MEKKMFSASTIMTPVIYREFYRLYYKERLRAFSITSAVIGIILIVVGIYLNKSGFGYVWSLIAVWIGAVLIVYPRMAYRKPYRKARNQKQTTRFTFYETFVSEKTNSKSTDYSYDGLERVIETNKYIIIFHSMKSISIVDKAGVKENADDLAAFLKERTVYKRIKK